MTAWDCSRVRPALGVYVVGAIDPAERAAVDAHLVTCSGCREELAGLAGLPALLHRVPVEEAERLAGGGRAADQAGGTPGEDLLPRLLARAGRIRRTRRRRGLAAAAAAALLALGGGVAAGLLSGSGPGPAVGLLSGGSPSASATARPGAGGPTSPAAGAWRTVARTDPRSGVTLTVRYAPAAWGTRMSVQAVGVLPGTVCQFEVTDTTGRHWTVGGWRATYQGGPRWYPAATSLTGAQLSGFELVSGHTVLARVHAAGAGE